MITKQEAIDNSLRYFDEGFACSQSILLAFSKEFCLDEKTAKLISSTFGGGMGRLREKCGAVTGAFMVLGLKYGNVVPNDMEAKLGAYRKVRELNHRVEELFGTTQCGELLKKHTTQSQVAERKHHQLICRKVVQEVTGLLYDIIYPPK